MPLSDLIELFLEEALLGELLTSLMLLLDEGLLDDVVDTSLGGELLDDLETLREFLGESLGGEFLVDTVFLGLLCCLMLEDAVAF